MSHRKAWAMGGQGKGSQLHLIFTIMTGNKTNFHGDIKMEEPQDFILPPLFSHLLFLENLHNFHEFSYQET